MFGSSSDGSRSPSAESDARGMSAGSDDVFAEKVLVKDYEVITLCFATSMFYLRVDPEESQLMEWFCFITSYYVQVHMYIHNHYALSALRKLSCCGHMLYFW